MLRRGETCRLAPEMRAAQGREKQERACMGESVRPCPV